MSRLWDMGFHKCQPPLALAFMSVIPEGNLLLPSPFCQSFPNQRACQARPEGTGAFRPLNSSPQTNPASAAGRRPRQAGRGFIPGTKGRVPHPFRAACGKVGRRHRYSCNFASNGFTLSTCWVLGPGGERLTEYAATDGWRSLDDVPSKSESQFGGPSLPRFLCKCALLQFLPSSNPLNLPPFRCR